MLKISKSRYSGRLLEGIIPALETSHAIAYLLGLKGKVQRGEVVLLNFSGRGDKDLETVMKVLKRR